MSLGGQRHDAAALPPGTTHYSLHRRLGGPQGRSGLVQKILPPPEFEPRIVHAVASRYTDYAIPAHDLFRLELIWSLNNLFYVRSRWCVEILTGELRWGKKAYTFIVVYIISVRHQLVCKSVPPSHDYISSPNKFQMCSSYPTKLAGATYVSSTV